MTARCCLACGHVYTGPLACPMCGEPGEPISRATSGRQTGYTAEDFRAGRCDWDDLPSEELAILVEVDLRARGASGSASTPAPQTMQNPLDGRRTR